MKRVTVCQMNMGTQLSLAAIIFLFTALFSAFAQEPSEPSLEPRLQAILKEVQSLQDALEAKRQERTAKYIADLKELEKAAQLTGDLDSVLQVSNERTAWESGKPTPAIDPKNESVLLAVRKLRFYFDRDIATLVGNQGINSAQHRARIANNFAELERVLTTEGKIAEALETRKIREQFVAGTLNGSFGAAVPPAIAEAKPASDKMEAATSKEPAKTTGFPLPDPAGYPPLPTEKGRIVLIPSPEALEIFDNRAIKKIERDDYDDLVALGQLMVTNKVAAIRADGRPVCWKADGQMIDPRNVSALKVWSGLGVDLMWVDDEGHVGTMGGGAEFEKELKRLGRVRYFSPSDLFAFAIDESRARHLIGSAREKPNVTRAFQDKNSVVAVEFGGTGYIMVLRNDGSIIQFLNDQPPTSLAPPQSCLSLLSYGNAVTTGGASEHFGLAENVKDLVEGTQEKVRKARNFQGAYLAFQLESGKWLVLKRNKLEWQGMEKVELALAGAIDVNFTPAGIVAILPSSSLPRSGLWDVDELIAARK